MKIEELIQHFLSMGQSRKKSKMLAGKLITILEKEAEKDIKVKDVEEVVKREPKKAKKVEGF